MSTKIYEFNPNAKPRLDRPVDLPLVNLAYANGFLPPTYAPALESLFDEYRVISLAARPLWKDCPPDSLKSWRQLGDDLLNMLYTITQHRIVGIGHSVGGVATMYAAAKHPDHFSHLILIEPTMLAPRVLRVVRLMRLLRQEVRMPLVKGALRRRRNWATTEDAYTYFRGKPLFKRCTDEMVRSYTESITAPDPNGGISLVFTPEWEAQIFRTVPTDVWRLPRQIKIPTLILRGELTDVFVEASAEQYHRLNPAAQIITIKGAGHLVPQEQPEAARQAIADFLTTHRQ